MKKIENLKLKIGNSCRTQAGFSVIEVILAAALFMIIATGSITVILQGLDSNRLGEEQTVANQYAAEGIEAVKSIKNQAYANLVNTAGCGLIRNASNVWAFQSPTCTNNTFDNGKYTRIIKVESVNRDTVPPAGNIVTSGTLDPDTKKITSTVSWNFSPSRANSVVLSTYLSDWRKPIVTDRGGILVYGDGGTTSDAMQYKILDGATGTWGAVTAFPDFDTGASNKALRAIRVYASATRNEKIVLSRHYNGSSQFIYAHRWDGTSWTSYQMVSWTASAFDTANQGIRNFDGQYLNNGNFIIVYSDNTTTPKYRTWNGSSWSPNPPTAGSSVANVGGIPSNVTLRNRDGSNETMLTVFDQVSDTNTTYYSGSAWSVVTEHATAAPTNTKEFAEFAWSSNPSSFKGALIYQTASNDKAMNLKIWAANGSGGGSWGGTNVNTVNQGTLGAMELDGGRKGAEEFLACDKDASNDIYCFRGNTAPAWISPTQNLMTATTDTGIQRSFDLAYEGSTGTEGIVVYADTTAPTTQARLKKYNAASNTFDTTATNLNTLGGALKTVKLRAISDNDDIMIIMGDANNDFYTVVWDGSTNAVYTTPSGKAFTAQGANGSNAIEYWYGFAWDKF